MPQFLETHLRSDSTKAPVVSSYLVELFSCPILHSRPSQIWSQPQLPPSLPNRTLSRPSVKATSSYLSLPRRLSSHSSPLELLKHHLASVPVIPFYLVIWLCMFLPTLPHQTLGRAPKGAHQSVCQDNKPRVSPKEGSCQLQAKTRPGVFFPDILLTGSQGPERARPFPGCSGRSLRRTRGLRIPAQSRPASAQRRSGAAARSPAGTSSGRPERRFRWNLSTERLGAFGRGTQEPEVSGGRRAREPTALTWKMNILSLLLAGGRVACNTG